MGRAGKEYQRENNDIVMTEHPFEIRTYKTKKSRGAHGRISKILNDGKIDFPSLC